MNVTTTLCLMQGLSHERDSSRDRRIVNVGLRKWVAGLYVFVFAVYMGLLEGTSHPLKASMHTRSN
jgi:hypothetical protein